MEFPGTNARRSRRNKAVRRRLAGLSVLGLLLAAAACGDNGDGRGHREFGTLAYVVNECRQSGHEIILVQELRLRTGEESPVSVTRVESPVLHAVPGLDCKSYRDFLVGASIVYVGAFQRLGVSPDGSSVVFEVTDDLSPVYPNMLVVAEQEGMFLVRSDGTGLRRIGPASREPSWLLVPDDTAPLGFRGSFFPYFTFSPEGGRITFTDKGPGPSGEEVAQVFTRNLTTGAPRQLTQLPLAPPDPVYAGTAVQRPSFFDPDTVIFATFANPVDDQGNELNPEGIRRFFTVRTDGTDVQAFPVPIPEGSGEVDPQFVITGAQREAINFVLDEMAVNPISYFDRATEAYIHDGGNLLQLTNFRRSDTWFPFYSATETRAFFIASTDERGTNPTENCQIFSIDPTGADLRQLTYFDPGEKSEMGCTGAPLPGCWVYFVNAMPISSQDARTGRLVFYSNCDPLGDNPHGGELFDMNADGSDLRQLTQTRGVVIESDGSLLVELPGPFAYGPYQ